MNFGERARVLLANDLSSFSSAASAMLTSSTTGISEAGAVCRAGATCAAPDGPCAIPDPPPQDISRGDPPVAERAASRGRVLVIEDDWLIASLVLGELTEYGYEVIGPARSVAQASSFAETAVIDAALVDLNLAGELPHAAIALLVQRRIPFLYMTAYSALPEGVDCAAPFLEKPFTRAELFAALEKILQAPPGA
jgi:CheY-like chemotaxis protein